ncbi:MULTISPECIES: hypothetical protein [unclassified Pseudomonas]|uniref:hypothetical protein n=1 Tax=unclassified Pseudomonas TaxID=196821 RepID=UPI0008718CD2|nr:MULTISPECIES: hypothetical protein [unclassified Pseudomonas]SCW94419.1 hypothetical protein SAMN03159481_03828 [Pseudomonas sp. NFACC56-3]SFK55590.1 hypothetical protein SAMN03159473_02638 [Pseudomonas sp. NFACC52]
MNTPLFSSHSERLQALKNTRVDFAVQVLLDHYLEPLDVNPFTAYVNTLVDFPKLETATSRTLFEETLAWVEKQSLPTYTQGISNVFNRRYSFAAEDRIKTLDLIAFEKIVIDVVASLMEKPAIDLSPRSLRPLAAEDVHGALKVHAPNIYPEGVYVTSFIDHGLGRRMVLSSERLVEYLLGHFKNDVIPFHSKGSQQGIYTVGFSGEERHLHPQLITPHLNDLVIKIVPDFLG